VFGRMMFAASISLSSHFHLIFISFLSHFHRTGRYQYEERYDSCSEMSPVTIAQQIVCEFRENMEQGELGGLSSEFQVESNLSGVNASAGAEAEAATGENMLQPINFCGFIGRLFYFLPLVVV